MTEYVSSTSVDCPGVDGIINTKNNVVVVTASRVTGGRLRVISSDVVCEYRKGDLCDGSMWKTGGNEPLPYARCRFVK